jgi:hypothetical protein
MKKLTCGFIDHTYHKKTLSTVFLREILNNEFDVTDIWIEDFSEQQFESLKNLDFDFFLVFQYDFLTSFLLSNNKRVISVPMYDGSGEVNIAHWLNQEGALLLNFSSTLQKIHQQLELKCSYFQYYPKLALKPRRSDYPKNTLRVFFWERSPSSGLSVRWLAEKLDKLKDPPESIHLHLSPDPTEYTSIHSSEVHSLFPYSKVTTSTWFHSRDDYIDTLSSCNLMICSRLSEGIGFSFLEAMSLGLAVIGIDNPTLNEYVTSNYNGLLLANLNDDFPELNYELINYMGKNAISEAERGLSRWERDSINLRKIINDYVSGPITLSKINLTPKKASLIANSFFRDSIAYTGFNTLNLSKTERIGKLKNLIPSRIAAHAAVFSSDIPMLRVLMKKGVNMLRRFD